MEYDIMANGSIKGWYSGSFNMLASKALAPNRPVEIQRQPLISQKP